MHLSVFVSIAAAVGEELKDCVVRNSDSTKAPSQQHSALPVTPAKHVRVDKNTTKTPWSSRPGEGCSRQLQPLVCKLGPTPAPQVMYSVDQSSSALGACFLLCDYVNEPRTGQGQLHPVAGMCEWWGSGA